MVRVLLLCCLSAAAVLPVGAQGRPITVIGVRGLSFGGVFPGLARTVLRTDPANSGQIDLTGNPNAQLQLTFTLPPALVGPGGATMLLVFAGGDAGYSSSQSIGSQVGFDPKQPFVATLSNRGRGSVFIGGTAMPAPTQAPGGYTATLTLTAAYLP